MGAFPRYSSCCGVKPEAKYYSTDDNESKIKWAVDVAGCQLVMHERLSTRNGFLKSFSVDSTYLVVSSYSNGKCDQMS